MIKDKILKAEPWEIFLVFIGVIILYKITPQDQMIVKIVTTFFLCSVILGWLLVLGLSLNRNLNEADQKAEELFISGFVYAFVFPVASAIDLSLIVGEINDAYLLIFGFLFCLSFFYMIYFCSTLFVYNQDKLIKQDKLKVEVVFLSFIVFIIGVFVLQPRIRKIFSHLDK